MIRYIITCPVINIYKLPNNDSIIDTCSTFKENIITGGLPFKGEDGQYWICYISKTGLLRYLPYMDKKKRKYVIELDSFVEKIIKEIKINYIIKKEAKKKHQEVKNELIIIKNNFNENNEEIFLMNNDFFKDDYINLVEKNKIYYQSEENLQILHKNIYNKIFNSK